MSTDVDERAEEATMKKEAVSACSTHEKRNAYKFLFGFEDPPVDGRVILK
jgi:hypothetical protein